MAECDTKGFNSSASDRGEAIFEILGLIVGSEESFISQSRCVMAFDLKYPSRWWMSYWD